MDIERCKLIDRPKITDPRGGMTFLESDQDILSTFSASITSRAS
jgi:hypothetical protein